MSKDWSDFLRLQNRSAVHWWRTVLAPNVEKAGPYIHPDLLKRTWDVLSKLILSH